MAEQASKVSGVVQIDGTPAQRTIRAFSYDAVLHAISGIEATVSKSLGHATSDQATGEYTIDLLGGYDKQIFVVAFDDYGADFTPDMGVAVGDRVHPTTPNGHVWEATSAGTLPSEEPAWVVDTGTAQLYGTASMIAKPFYRPMVHGPVEPEVTTLVVGDEFFGNVSLLLHMDGPVGSKTISDSSNQNTTLINIGDTEIVSGGKFGNCAYLNGSTKWLEVTHSIGLSLEGKIAYTGEAFIKTTKNTGIGALFVKRSSTTPQEYSFLIVDGVVGFYAWGASENLVANVVSNSQVANGVWHHVAFCLNSNEVSIFIDGVLESSGPIGAVKGNTENLHIGNDPSNSGRRFEGVIDEVRLTSDVARHTDDFTPPVNPFSNQAL